MKHTFSKLSSILGIITYLAFPYASLADTNLATSGTATQSSTAWAASRAIDDNTYQYNSGNSISSTNNNSTAWWQVDLGEVKNISTITLWKRLDSYAINRLTNFYVFVSDDPFSSTNPTTTSSQSGVQATYHSGVASSESDFTINRTGRYVRVQLTGTQYLQLAEVQVFGSDIPINNISSVPLAVSSAVEPNVMLLIDTSGSMDHVIWSDSFDSSITYTDYGYGTSGQYFYSAITSSGCSSGYKSMPNSSKCLLLPSPNGDNTRYELNYLNYLFDTYNNNQDLTSIIPNETRMDVAKEVATDIVSNTSGIRFGVSGFYGVDWDADRYGEGATVHENCDNNNTAALTSAISGLSASHNTPLAEAYYEVTRYFRGMSSFYQSGVSYTSPIQYRCQKNFGIAITDGLPTYDSHFPSANSDPADLADTSASLPNWDGSTTAADETGAAEDVEGSYLYLDDIAKFAYDIDLITSGNDDDGVSYEDPDFDQQNLETYTVGFNIDIDMLSEAAAYGNGAYYQASNTSQLTAALTAAVESAQSKVNGSTAPAAVNSGRLETDSAIYKVTYESTDWSGDIYAHSLNSIDGSVSATVNWQASNNIPAENSRDIFSYDATASSGDGYGIEFEWGNLNSSMIADLSNSIDATYGSELLNWVRGDSSSGGTYNGSFRTRTSMLGDIVNSSPLYVGQYDFNHDLLPSTEGSTYNAFINTSGYLGRNDTIYAGANDGMLHAFNASNGSETFAYIPSFIFSKLPGLASNSYADNHQFYVDGPQYAAPAYINSTWKTVLVGSTGAGARGIYALDVSRPSSFDEDNVLWEFTDADDSDLGYSIAQPTIVRLPDGNWYAAVGNGYVSDDGEAVLFLINLATGVATKIATGNGDASNPNGLSSPVPVDLDGDHIVDVIYAGDYRGNLWRFGFTTTSSGGWTSNILFTATAPSTSSEQHLTTRPAVGAHPDGGVMVYFGTGKYFETGDASVPTNPEIETFYGVRDTADLTSANLNGDRSDLQPQTVEHEEYGITVGSTTRDVRIISNNTVDYTSKRGWYLDLPTDGERVVQVPRVHNGRIIFVTLIPISGACTAGGNSWLMEMDAVSGKRLTTSVIDVNGDGVIDSDDMVTIDGVDYPVSGLRYEEILTAPAIVQTDGKEFKYMNGSNGNINSIAETGGYSSGRQSWRRIR